MAVQKRIHSFPERHTNLKTYTISANNSVQSLDLTTLLGAGATSKAVWIKNNGNICAISFDDEIPVFTSNMQLAANETTGFLPIQIQKINTICANNTTATISVIVSV